MSAPHQGLTPAPGIAAVLEAMPDLYAPDFDQRDPYSWTEEQIDAYDATTAAEFTAPAAEPDIEQQLRDSIDLAQARTPGLALVPKPKRSLGNHVARIEFIADTIEQLDDEEMSQEVRDALSAELIEELAGTRQKVDAVSAALGMFESLAAASEREIERLAKRVERYQRQRERLETYVLAVLTASQLDRIEGETSTLSKRLNPPAVQIAEGAQIPYEFLFYPEAPPPRPDKAAIKKALTAKRRIPGCTLVRGERLVRS